MRKIRFFTKGAVFLFSLVSCSNASAALTEEDVVKKGLEYSVFQAQISAQLSEAESRLKISGQWENPTIEYSRETVDLPDGNSEETALWIEQRINVAGVKGLETKSANSQLKSSQAKARFSISERKRHLRESFYLTLSEKRKLHALIKQHSQLQSVASIVEKRVSQGDASKFELLRINQQVILVMSEKNQTQAELKALQQSLFSRLKLEVQDIDGKLLPHQASSASFEAKQHPSIQALNDQQQALLWDAEAASRKRWPELTIGLGYKEIEESNFSSDGNMFSVGIDIPLFKQASGQQQIAKSQASRLKADITLQKRELEAQYNAANIQYQTLKATASQLKSIALDTGASLGRLAEISYHAGELGVMELLDAYQSDLETHLRFIDTALAARVAYIQLQHLRGE